MDFHGTAWLAWFWKPRNKEIQEIRRLCLQQSFDLECTLPLCSGWTASQLLFVFFCCLVCFFLLLQKANQTATTKINVKFDHCYVTDRLHHVCLLFPDYIRSALPPFSAYSQTKPLWKLLLVMCHGKCAACMGCGSVSYAFFL